MYLLNYLIPSSDPTQWDKLMAHNVVRVSSLLKIILCAILMNPMYLLNHLIPSSEPKQWDKLMAHNVVRVSYAAQSYFVCYAYEPNVPFESPYPFLRAKTVG